MTTLRRRLVLCHNWSTLPKYPYTTLKVHMKLYIGEVYIGEVCIYNAKSTLERVSNAVYCCINGVFRELRHDSVMNII